MLIIFIRQTLLWCGAIYLYSLGTTLVLKGEDASSTICFSFGTILLFIVNLDRIKYFKGFGLEARTRELKEKIDEADRLLNELKRLSMISGKFIVDLACRQGRWGSSTSADHVFNLKNEIKDQLYSVGLQESEINDAINSWVKWTSFDIAIKATEELRKELNQVKHKASPEQIIEISTFENRLAALDVN